MRDRLIGLVILVGASLANLPIVHAAIATQATPLVTILAGSLAVGLAWAAGFHIQRKRRPLVLGVAVVGMIEGVAALVPALGAPDGARAWMGACGLLSALAFVVIAGTAPAPTQA